MSDPVAESGDGSAADDLAGLALGFVKQLLSPRSAHLFSLVLALIAGLTHIGALASPNLLFTLGPGQWPPNASLVILAVVVLLGLSHVVALRSAVPAGWGRYVLAVAGTFWVAVTAIQIVRLVLGPSTFGMRALGLEWGLGATVAETVVVGACAIWCTVASYAPALPAANWKRLWGQGTPTLAPAVLGLVLAFVAAFPAALVFAGLAVILTYASLLDTLDMWMLVWVGIIGAQAAIVSILVRLRRLSVTDDQPNLLFLNSLFKPFVGMTFAQLSYCMVRAGIFGLSVDGSVGAGKKATFAYVVLAFAAGFSERFAGDLVKRVGSDA